MRCAVFNCINSNNNKSNPYRFYSFPRDKQLLEKWKNFCRRSDYFNYKTARICSAHFRPDDFQRNIQYEMGLCQRNAFKLKPGTVPMVETTNCKKMKARVVQTGPGPEPVSISRVSLESCPISCVTVKAEPGEFIGDTNEPVAFIISAIKEEVKEENYISEIKIEPEAITDYNTVGADRFEYVNSVTHPSPPTKQQLQDQTQALKEGLAITNHNAADVERSEFFNLVNLPSPPANQQLHDQMQALKKELVELRYNKSMLQKTAKQHASEIHDLKRRIVKAVYERDNIQEKLLQIFSKEQVNSLMNGTETQAWTEADIEQSFLLYSTSSKAYKMLRENNFPLPTVETLLNWKKKKTDTSTDSADSICG